MKTVYGWVVDWPHGISPQISIDLFFSSKEKFYDVYGRHPTQPAEEEQLVPIQVSDDFDDLDFIPENY